MLYSFRLFGNGVNNNSLPLIQSPELHLDPSGSENAYNAMLALKDRENITEKIKKEGYAVLQAKNVAALLTVMI